MQFIKCTLVYVTFACLFRQTRTSDADEWLRAPITVNLVNATDIKKPRNGMVDYISTPFELTPRQIENLQAFPESINYEKMNTVESLLKTCAEKFIMEIMNDTETYVEWITFEGQNRNAPSETDRHMYRPYRLNFSIPVPSAPIRSYTASYLGSASNEAVMWFENDKDTTTDVEFVLATATSKAFTEAETSSSKTSYGGGMSLDFNIFSAAIKAGIEREKSSGEASEQSTTTTSEETKTESLKLTIPKRKSAKLYRNIKMSLQTSVHLMTLEIDGYFGVQLWRKGYPKLEKAEYSLAHSLRRFLPVSELAKVYPDFVVDYSKENGVVFTHSMVSRTSGWAPITEFTLIDTMPSI